MFGFGAKAKLVRSLDSLAFYNDKGSSYSRHSLEQVDAEQVAKLSKIRDLVKAVGESRLPKDFLVALDSGELASDMTGKYVLSVKDHFKARTAV